MPIDVLEGKPTNINLKVVENRSQLRSSRCAFKFSGTAKSGKRKRESHNGTIDGGGEATLSWTPPALERDEPFRDYEVTATAGRQTAPGKLIYRVWPAKVTVQVRTYNGQPVAQTTIIVSVLWRGRRRVATSAVTDDRGLAKDVELPAAGPVKISMGTGTGQVYKQEGQGRAYRATLAPPWRAGIVWPVPGDRPHKQYVNLEQADDHPENGNRIKVYAVPDHQDRAEVGELIHFRVEFHSENSKRNVPKPTVLEPSTRVSAGVYTVGKTLTVDGDGDLSAFVTLELGKAGGDRVTVKAGSTAECADHEVSVRTWRRLYYRVIRPNFGNFPDDLPTAIRTKLVNAMNPAHVELTKLDAKTLSDDELAQIDSSAKINGQRLFSVTQGEVTGRQALVVDCDNTKALRKFDSHAMDSPEPDRTITFVFHDGFFASGKTITHVVTVRNQTDLDELLDGVKVTDEGLLLDFDLGGGKYAVDVKWRPRNRLAEAHRFVEHHSKKMYLTTGMWISVPIQGHVSLSTDSSRYVEVKLPGSVKRGEGWLEGPVRLVKNYNEPIQVKISAVCREAQRVMGNADGRCCYVHYDRGSANLTELASTVIHEVGHLLGQVVAFDDAATGAMAHEETERATGIREGDTSLTLDEAREEAKKKIAEDEKSLKRAHCQSGPPGLDGEPHQYAYVERGHSGPHCFKGIGLKTKYTNAHSANARCVMYGAEGVGSGRPGPGIYIYCSECLRFLKATDLTTVSFGIPKHP